MNIKRDRISPRTPEDIERKYAKTIVENKKEAESQNRDLASLNIQLKNLLNSVNRIKSQIIEINEEYENVGMSIEQIDTDIQEIDEEIITINSEINNINNNIATINTRVTNITTTINSHINKELILKNKKIGVIGDSLIYGNILGNSVTWVSKIEESQGMISYNYGINGNPVAYSSSNANPMCIRYASMRDDLDYIVVLGGANDYRLNIPIGDNTDSVNNTFKGALNILIDGLLEKYPQKKILFMTNYHRTGGINSLGVKEVDYVDAMIEICELKGIPCFDNYRKCGLSWSNTSQVAWMDEGVSLNGNMNLHFNEAGYNFLLNIYENLLKRI